MGGELRREVELLNAVLERAQQVAARLEDEHEDEELMARQCWQDRDDFSGASLCDLREACCSSPEPDYDVGNLRDLNDFSSNGSSPSGSPRYHIPRPRLLRSSSPSPSGSVLRG